MFAAGCDLTHLGLGLLSAFRSGREVSLTERNYPWWSAKSLGTRRPGGCTLAAATNTSGLFGVLFFSTGRARVPRRAQVFESRLMVWYYIVLSISTRKVPKCKNVRHSDLAGSARAVDTRSRRLYRGIRDTTHKLVEAGQHTMPRWSLWHSSIVRSMPLENRNGVYSTPGRNALIVSTSHFVRSSPTLKIRETKSYCSSLSLFASARLPNAHSSV